MKVGKMQRKLSEKAERVSDHKFDDLIGFVTNIEWLRVAHQSVSQNAGSKTAGCDGLNMSAFNDDLEDHLKTIRRQFKKGNFEPHPVRRVYIPKKNGKKRPLGIPAIRDRIVQEALRMTLEPIFEADFCQDSFGFRPNRCTMDAVTRIYRVMNNSAKYFWAVEGDISSYFDTVCHKKLMKLLRRRVKDQKLLDVIWSFLKAGVMENALFTPTKRGVPQGGIVSPLLANVYLHELDKYMEDNYTNLSRYERRKRRKSGKGNFVYSRYADDFVVMCNGGKADAEKMKEELYEFLRDRLKLKLSKEKTKITHANDGFEFLGIGLVRQRGKSGKKVTRLFIPTRAMAAMRGKIKEALGSATHESSVRLKIIALNRIIRGWTGYYRYTSRATTQFSKLCHLLFWRMAHWLGRKFQIRMPEVMRRFRRGNTLGTKDHQLLMPDEVKTKRYTKPGRKPNPYTATQQEEIKRERLPNARWLGSEKRPGSADLRQRVLERDDYTCQISGKNVTEETAHVDHIKPRHTFDDPARADRLENLQTLHVEMHNQKTKSERRTESRMR